MFVFLSEFLNDLSLLLYLLLQAIVLVFPGKKFLISALLLLNERMLALALLLELQLKFALLMRLLLLSLFQCRATHHQLRLHIRHQFLELLHLLLLLGCLFCSVLFFLLRDNLHIFSLLLEFFEKGLGGFFLGCFAALRV